MQDEFRHMIRIARNTQQLIPPDDFTHRVMGRISAPRQNFFFKIKGILSDIPSSWEGKFPQRKITGTDCSLCFLAAGYFYLIVGIVFILGLKKIHTEVMIPQWIMLQPKFVLVTAFAFVAVGILLMRRNIFSIRVAYVITSFYIGIVLINGMIAYKFCDIIPISILGILCFTSAGILMGLFLSGILQRYRTYIEKVQQI